MDLLKAYNYVPAAEKNENQILKNVTNFIQVVMNSVKVKAIDYDFMDLLADKGYVPVNDNWVKRLVNDNVNTFNIAS